MSTYIDLLRKKFRLYTAAVDQTPQHRPSSTMGLVDYSESESSGSEAEGSSKQPAKTALTNSKKQSQKVVDRSNSGKIVVNLPKASADENEPKPDGPPTKRARTGGGGLFSGLNSFLPAPKNNGAKPIVKSSASGAKAPGFNLKTSTAPGFSREANDIEYTEDGTPAAAELAAPKREAAPSIPEGQKSADEVKMTGKPLMFRPLSVSHNAKKKKTPKPPALKAAASPITPAPPAAPAPPPKKVSLFSMHTEEAGPQVGPPRPAGVYEPLFDTGEADQSQHEYYENEASQQAAANGPESVGTIADDLNLSAAARRELFGREGGGSHAAKRVINFNMDKEYQHNQELRASGEQQIHNPVRAIQGGKHNLRQLVQNVQNQRDALEESFAMGKDNRKDASSRYGW